MSLPDLLGKVHNTRNDYRLVLEPRTQARREFDSRNGTLRAKFEKAQEFGKGNEAICFRSLFRSQFLAPILFIE